MFKFHDGSILTNDGRRFIGVEFNSFKFHDGSILTE